MLMKKAPLFIKKGITNCQNLKWSFLVFVKRLSHLLLYIKLMDTFILLIGETEMGAKCFL